jgi:hypothetical protein
VQAASASVPAAGTQHSIHYGSLGVVFMPLVLLLLLPPLLLLLLLSLLLVVLLLLPQ